MTRRRSALAGCLAIAVYLAGVALSGWLSPLSRRPILDGTGALPPYNWVNPPPELADTNLRPSGGRFRVRFAGRTSRADVLSTPDLQWTLVIDDGTLELPAGDHAARMSVEPLDPATLPPLPGVLQAAGNAYRIEASFEPSSEPVMQFARPARVVLVYAALIDVHGPHTILFSADGAAWQELDTADVSSVQQAGAPIERPGLVIVAGRPRTPTPQADGGLGGVTLVVGVVVACLALVGLGLATRLLRRRS